MPHGLKLGNEYAHLLGRLYARTPKAVLAAIAVSLLTSGGDNQDGIAERFLNEWEALYANGIVPQKPLKND